MAPAALGPGKIGARRGVDVAIGNAVPAKVPAVAVGFGEVNAAEAVFIFEGDAVGVGMGVVDHGI